MTTALDKIKAIQQKAEEEIEALRREAAHELARKIAEAKATLKALELEYEQVTGKPVRATEAPEAPETGKRAKRLTEEERTVLAETIKTAIKAFGGGMKFSEIVREVKTQGLTVADTQIRQELKGIKGLVSKGERAATTYSVK